jgi:hypothetical protein
MRRDAEFGEKKIGSKAVASPPTFWNDRILKELESGGLQTI